MARYTVKTESGSVYQVDTDMKTLARKAGEDAGELDYDESPVGYVELVGELAIGNPLRVVWDDKPAGKLRLRTSTPIVAIERT